VHVALLISRFVLDLAKEYGTRGVGGEFPIVPHEVALRSIGPASNSS